MANAIFDFESFSTLTDQLMSKAPDRAKALMVENNAYYMLVSMHIHCSNMVEFADDHESGLETLIESLEGEVERIQGLKGSRWLEDFIKRENDQ